MDGEEIQTLGSCMSTLGEIDTPVMDSVNRDFYNMVEAGSSKLNAKGMDLLRIDGNGIRLILRKYKIRVYWCL